MADLTTEVRRACLVRLKAHAPLLALLPKERVYSGVTPPSPVWPFVKWGAASSVPVMASCLEGENIRVTVHGFGRARVVGSSVVETGEDHAGRLAAAIKGALHRYGVDTPSGHVRLTLLSEQRLQDGGEADDWHVVCDFRARVVA